MRCEAGHLRILGIQLHMDFFGQFQNRFNVAAQRQKRSLDDIAVRGELQRIIHIVVEQIPDVPVAGCDPGIRKRILHRIDGIFT